MGHGGHKPNRVGRTLERDKAKGIIGRDSTEFGMISINLTFSRTISLKTSFVFSHASVKEDNQ